MELVFGGSVAKATVVAHGGLGERGAHDVLLSVAAALRYLHEEAGVVHGDVKGRNMLLGGRCAPKTKAAVARRGWSPTTPYGPRGMPAWMAPEVRAAVWRRLLTWNRPWSELGDASDVGELLLVVGFGGGAKARTG